MKSKIVLNVYRPEKGMCGVVRLNDAKMAEIAERKSM